MGTAGPRQIDLKFPKRWAIEQAVQIADTPAGIVHEVVLHGGLLAIVKQLKPKVLEDSRRGADFLEWRDGVGCVRLLDRTRDLFLMEHAGNETLRDLPARDGDDAAAQVAIDVLLDYHQPSDQPPPPSLLALPRYFQSLFAKSKRDQEGGGVPGSLYIEAALLAEHLIAKQQDIRPLHGDLHHENIMKSPRGWIIIDPAGLIGDPAMDVANMFSNPLDHFHLTRNEERIASMAARFAMALKRDERTILQYAFAYGCLSAAWHEEDGNAKDRDDELAVAQAIKDVLGQF